jgi:acylphosphatase
MEQEGTRNIRRLAARFDGHVQGVGFRFTTVEVARDFAVQGFVQNMVDGSVKVVAEGEESELMRFLDALRASQIYRHVIREDISWPIATGELEGFTIRYA